MDQIFSMPSMYIFPVQQRQRNLADVINCNVFLTNLINDSFKHPRFYVCKMDSTEYINRRTRFSINFYEDNYGQPILFVKLIFLLVFSVILAYFSAIQRQVVELLVANSPVLNLKKKKPHYSVYIILFLSVDTNLYHIMVNYKNKSIKTFF